MIEPGATLGVLGGGQLGSMFALAARRLGYRVAVWDPDPVAPGMTNADVAVTAPFTDPSALDTFATTVQAATYEWENIPADTCEAVEQHVPVKPGSCILRLLQNRLHQKSFLAERGFPVTPFRAASSPAELFEAAGIGFPCLCKTATAGYDGKGQWRLETVEHLQALADELARQSPPTACWILEEWVMFEKEVSVLVVRGEDGNVRVYPVVENVHEDGILRTTRVPAAVGSKTAEQAMTLARAIVESLGGVGVFCVEMFVVGDGRLYINEVAPRPHNSGHYTLDACTVSQFEQQVRTVAGLPLGEVRLLTPATMVNLIGDDLKHMQSAQGLQRLLQHSGAVLHIYGKRTLRPRRKMGHVTFLADKAETTWEAACMLRALQKQQSGGDGGAVSRDRHVST